MKPVSQREQYRSLQRFAGWEAALDVQRLQHVGDLLRSDLESFVDRFYEQLLRHPATAVYLRDRRLVERLRGALGQWLRELFSGSYGESYLASRRRAGLRHAAMDVPQSYVTIAIGNLRSMMTRRLIEKWPAGSSTESLWEHIDALHRLIDLDQAVIESAHEEAVAEEEKDAVRARLEGVLHKERELSEGLLENARVLVLVLDTRGRVVRFNRFTEDVTGYRLEQVKGRCWFERFLPEEEHAAAQRELEELLRGADASETTQTIVTTDGSRRVIRWASKVLRDPDGAPVGVLAVGHDITQLQESQERALQAERLAAIGRTSTGLAHESRNALQRIQASSEVLELEVEDNPRALEHVRRIQKAGQHMGRLLEELRGYAAPIKLDLAEASLAAAWREAWKLLENAWRHRDVDLIEEGVDVEPRIVMDHFRLVQVFRNILENALAACSDPVKIVIAARHLAEDDAVEVTVSDNGPGMNLEQRKRIFEPFFTTKSKGTGLGMALAQRFVEAHGGRIRAECPSAGGTRITIVLPREPAVAVVAEAG